MTRRLEFLPHLRGHVQNSVDFWRTAYSASFSTAGALDIPLYRSGDRELSALSSGTFGAEVRYRLLPLASATKLTVGVRSDLILTVFHDALFVKRRTASLNMVHAELSFE
jgi:hypothetical protein